MAKRILTTIDDLIPDAANANRGTDRGRATLDDSLDVYGAGRSALADRTGVVLAGNKTVAAWKKKGGKVRFVETDGTELVVVVRNDLDATTTPALARGLAYADNRVAELGLSWDPARLAVDLDAGVDLSRFFEPSELETILADVAGAGRRSQLDPDRVPEPRATTIARGDAFTLGRHRLLCGDSTKADSVARFVGADRACLMFTDPPYGVNYKNQKSTGAMSISGDISQATIPIAVAVSITHALDDDARVYICGGEVNLGMHLAIFDHHLRQHPKLIVWVKEQFVMRPNNYHAQFELIFFGWKGAGGGPSHWHGDRKQCDVWNIRRDARADYEHPTQKPVELAERAILNSSPAGGIVFEPFAGSGSTLIACERNQRRCIAIESDPSFCQVIIDRWEAFTGKTAKPLHLDHTVTRRATRTAQGTTRTRRRGNRPAASRK